LGYKEGEAVYPKEEMKKAGSLAGLLTPANHHLNLASYFYMDHRKEGSFGGYCPSPHSRPGEEVHVQAWSTAEDLITPLALQAIAHQVIDCSLCFPFSFIIHMCMQGLGHFSPLPPPPPLPPTPPPPSPLNPLDTQQKLFCPYF
jgi:hypothetical protein